MSRLLATAPLLLLLLVVSAPARAAATYDIVDLGTLGAGGTQAHGINASGQIAGEATTSAGESRAVRYAGSLTDLQITSNLSSARAINASGQIAGYYYDRAYQAFLWTDGRLRDLGTLGGNYAAGYALNAAGHVCGSSFTRANQEHAFWWQGKRMTDLGTLGGEYSTARGINAGDQVVGYAYLASGAFHGFLWNGGTMRDLGTLGGDYSAAYAINDAGQVVGQAAGPGNVVMHAALWNDGAPQDLGDLGARISQAFAVNPRGTQIVGNAVVQSASGFVVYHAFLWSDGAMRDLNDLIPPGTNWVLEEANGINDAGQITGWGERDGVVHAFLLVPNGSESPVAAPGEAAEDVRETKLWRLGPNPARARVELGYALPRDGRATLQVLDVAGRVVRSLVNGAAPAGTHAATWNLDDDAGHQVGSGAYFVRLVVGGDQRTMRMTVVQ